MTERLNEFFNPLRLGSFQRRAAVSVGLVPIADYLLFRQPIGLSLTAFVILVAAGATFAAGARALRSHTLVAACILIAAILPMVDGTGPLAILFALMGLIVFSLTTTGRFARGAGPAPTDPVWFGLTGGGWIVRDIVAVATRSRRTPRAPTVRGARLLTWIVPVLLFAVFLALLSSANPLIEGWLTRYDPWALVSDVDFPRVLFWGCVLVLVWPFIRPRIRRRIRPAALLPIEAPPVAGVPWKALVFGTAAIFRSLVLFNGLFAVQSTLDLIYLWNGATLPDHLGYAAYAHRGAYPLVVTALLAGAFLIAATQEGGEAARSRAIRALIHLWTAQNLLLVASSIFRLDLYVAAYSLTYLRFAAFIWMLLTATGLVLILVRMSLDKSNSWLIASNFAALVCVLYVSTFVDFPGVISGYNVRHSLEMSGSGSHLDVDYLQSLGPRALPALDDYVLQGPVKPSAAASHVCEIRRDLSTSFSAESADWRGWSLNRWRLDRYLTSGVADEAKANCWRMP